MGGLLAREDPDTKELFQKASKYPKDLPFPGFFPPVLEKIVLEYLQNCQAKVGMLLSMLTWKGEPQLPPVSLRFYFWIQDSDAMQESVCVEIANPSEDWVKNFLLTSMVNFQETINRNSLWFQESKVTTKNAHSHWALSLDVSILELEKMSVLWPLVHQFLETFCIGKQKWSLKKGEKIHASYTNS